MTTFDFGGSKGPVHNNWVSAGKTRNWMLHDPVLDWLDLYGEAAGYVRDDKVPGYDQRTDFSLFIMEKGLAFEERVYDVLANDIDIVFMERPTDFCVEDHAARTVDVLKTMPEAVAQACVADPETKTFGYPDLLVRSDVVSRLWPDAFHDEIFDVDAPNLGIRFHYVVVDIKYTTIKLKADSTVGNDGSSPAYKGQLFVYNRALAHMQGYQPPTAFLLGRSWNQVSKKSKRRGTSALERLGPVPLYEVPKKGATLEMQVDDAIAWFRRLRKDGAKWQAMPLPSTPELRPNMCNTLDAPWHQAKKIIADATGELTTLWMVGVNKRNAALEKGVARWQDVKRSGVVDIKGPKTELLLDAILDVNRLEGPPLRPAFVLANAHEWAIEPELEFYVDFETVSDLDDDFSRFPKRGGQPLIFMVGCGHVEDGQWHFREFTVDRLTPEAEAAIIEDWFDHMGAVTARLHPGGVPKIIHWSHAEVSSLESAYNSAVARHPDRSWPRVNWFDFLKCVVKAEPIVVRGALGFGLKAIAKSMYAHGLIKTNWSDGPTDGLGAMVGAWRAAAEAEAEGLPLDRSPLIRDIASYNEVDVRVMWEIVQYLRTHHVDQGLVKQGV